MGQKYAAYGTSGAIVGFYDSIDSPLPSTAIAIEITEAQWLECLTNPGYIVTSGVLVAPAAPTAAEVLAAARVTQYAAIDASYNAAIAVDVSFTTAAGVVKTYQADSESQSLLLQNTQAYTIANAVPIEFYWRAADNTQVPFTLADLQGLNGAVVAQDWAAFQTRSTRKDAIAAATTVAAVQAITWEAATTATSATSTSSA